MLKQIKRIQNLWTLRKEKKVTIQQKEHIVFGYEALLLFMKKVKPRGNILDIGSGYNQLHANILKENGFNVTTNDFFNNADIQGDYLKLNIEKKFDGIWLSHVLEHVTDVHSFLLKLSLNLEEGSYIAITVPPLKHQVVGGHINLFNAGILIYRLILAGYDCSQAHVKSYGYNISVIVQFRKIRNMPQLRYDAGDIEMLSTYFPTQAFQGFDGRIKNYNWG